MPGKRRNRIVIAGSRLQIDEELAIQGTGKNFMLEKPKRILCFVVCTFILARLGAFSFLFKKKYPGSILKQRFTVPFEFQEEKNEKNQPNKTVACKMPYRFSLEENMDFKGNDINIVSTGSYPYLNEA